MTCELDVTKLLVFILGDRLRQGHAGLFIHKELCVTLLVLSVDPVL